ncbi:MAG: DUF3868 domain-containing protein [Bacteroidales bacterium]|nr:DUF3868 domain-containing protein [Candidatus Physcousia equi]
MKRLIIIILYNVLACATALAANNDEQRVRCTDIHVTPSSGYALVSMNMVVEELKLARNHQIFVTPFIESEQASKSIMLPTYVLSGRNMHYAYMRSGATKASGKMRYHVAKEIYVDKEKSDTIPYTQRIPLEEWMLGEDAVLRMSIDYCGCGRNIAAHASEQRLALAPASHMLIVPYPRPVAEVPTITYHHGKARVEFEVDKFELHEQVYSYVHKTTRRRHVIDNRSELKMIDDSIRYALSDPNVEIDAIKLCGYASPESPYVHNDYLASNRSRALAEYIAQRYHLPKDRCTFSAVPENWEGFRQQVLDATTISETQRKDLLELIDRPTYGPTDFDNKENELINGKKFAALYRQQIHPDWFPKLRYTDFVIQTRLKPLSVAQLHEVMAHTPELMSLNQIYTVAADCEHGGEEFHRAMEVALKYFPNDETANCNAAALTIEQKDYNKAAAFLLKAGESDEANILRAIVEASKLNYSAARELLLKAKNTPEAKRNLKMLP